MSGQRYLDDFSGGLNLRDSPNEIAPNETPNAKNYLLDERGGIKRRGGCLNFTTLPGVSGKRAYIFYSKALDLLLCARETAGAPNTFKLHTQPGNPTGVWTDRGTINSNVASEAAFIDFPLSAAGGPKVVIATNGNGATRGIWTLDGAFTLTNVSGNGIEGDFQGNAIALWQNKAWVAGFPVSSAVGNPTSLFACAPGDPTKWTVANGGITQQFRDLDAQPLTALGVVSGALVVFKKRSVYRVTDSATGQFTTIDSFAGALNPRCVASCLGVLFVVGPEGFYECDGSGVMSSVGDKLRPLWPAVATAIPCAFPLGDTVIVTTEISQATGNILQFYPRLGAFVNHQLPNAAADQPTSICSADGSSAFGSPGAVIMAIADADKIFSVFTEQASGMGKDDATGYAASWLTPWLLPNSGQLARVNLAMLQGLAGLNTVVSVDVFKDWNSTTPRLTFDVSSSLAVSSVDSAAAQMRSLDHAQAFAFRFFTDAVGGAGRGLSIRALQLVDVGLGYPPVGYPKGIFKIPSPSGRGPRPSPTPAGRGAPPPLPPPNP